MIGIEGNVRVTAERRDLIVEVRSDLPLQREDCKVVLLGLIVSDLGGRIDGNPNQVKNLRLIRIRRNLKVTHRRSRDQAKSSRRSEEVREVAETGPLIGRVMDRGRTAGRRFEPAVAAVILTGR